MVLESRPSFQLDANATFVIAGGFGGIGRSTARWMADRNAKHLILLSRSGARSESAQKLVGELQEKGIRVEAPSCDITNLDRLKEVFTDLKDLPPIRGCVQASLVQRVSEVSCYCSIRTTSKNFARTSSSTR